jgi:ATP-binding cassette subfamily B protein
MPATDPQQDADEKEAEALPLDWGLIRWLFVRSQPHARQRNALLVLVLMRSIQLPCLAWGIGQIVDGPITSRSPSGLFWGVTAFLAFAAFTQFCFHFRIRLALELGEAVVHDLRRDVFNHLQQMRMSFFHKTKLGQIISRMTSDIEALRAAVQEVLFSGLVCAGQMMVAALFMLWYDPVMFGVLVCLVPVLWVINRHFRRELSRAHRDVHESMSRVTASLAESVNGIQITQAFVRQDVNAERFHGLVMNHAGHNLRAARTAGLFLPVLELNSQLFIAVLLVLGGYRVLNPQIQIPIGDLIRFFFLANILFAPVQILGDLYNQLLTAMAGAERLSKLLDTPSDWCDPTDAVEMVPLSGHVQFEGLSFGYDPKRPVLHDIDLTALPGQTIALVGHTGSGKSSLVQLLAKFYLPTSGRLLIDGVDVRELSTDSLHRQLGIVLQANFLFSGTVMDNIRLGRPGASDEEVVDAARRLDCADLLEALPNGLLTEVGECGRSLSLGQRQLVCFARAMLADPRILILDEATSSVDMITEARIQQALAKLLAGRTSFVVAHRLSTIRHADQVLVLDQGRIVERGRHGQLVADGGIYAGLYDQFTRANAA